MKLQNNFTTPEQSKRLLELGLPKDSADCYLEKSFFPITPTWKPQIIRGHNTYSQWERGYTPLSSDADAMFPCWSVGRLIEIELLCREQREGMFARLSFYLTDKQPIDGIGTGDIVEGLVRYLESKDYKYDFSKLED